MISKGGCKIVNIASDSGVAAFPNETEYGYSKAALIGLTRVIAKEMGRYGVYCNAICPRYTRKVCKNERRHDNLLQPTNRRSTPLLKETLLTTRDKEREYAEATALKRIAKLEDIAKVVLFLSCHLSDHVTGEHILDTTGDIMS